jgi:hypothetical protein
MTACCGKEICVCDLLIAYDIGVKRYLRATKWNSANVAIERLEGTLKWRREFGVYDDSMAELVEPEVRCFLPPLCAMRLIL